MEMREIVFLCVAALTAAPCFVVAFSRNILYSAFALFFTFLGTSGLYFFLDAEFLAVVQLMIYIGGVLVLLLFAILLTKNIDNIRSTNLVSRQRAIMAGGSALVLFAALAYVFVSGGATVFVAKGTPEIPFGAAEIGDLLLTRYLLPFEAVSILLLTVLIAGLVVSGRAIK